MRKTSNGVCATQFEWVSFDHFVPELLQFNRPLPIPLRPEQCDHFAKCRNRPPSPVQCIFSSLNGRFNLCPEPLPIRTVLLHQPIECGLRIKKNVPAFA